LSRARKGPFKNTHHEELLGLVLRGLLDRTKVNPALIDDVQVGNVLPPGNLLFCFLSFLSFVCCLLSPHNKYVAVIFTTLQCYVSFLKVEVPRWLVWLACLLGMLMIAKDILISRHSLLVCSYYHNAFHSLLSLPDTSSVATVNRQCSSGLQACANIAQAIQAGVIEIGIGAGVESMTMNYGPGAMPSEMSERVLSCGPAADCLIPMGISFIIYIATIRQILLAFTKPFYC
jgi:hypothetical protein